jgi:hypothetical protein
MLQNELPRVNYVTTLDQFVLLCLVVNFVCALEYVLLSWLLYGNIGYPNAPSLRWSRESRCSIFVESFAELDNVLLRWKHVVVLLCHLLGCV